MKPTIPAASEAVSNEQPSISRRKLMLGFVAAPAIAAAASIPDLAIAACKEPGGNAPVPFLREAVQENPDLLEADKMLIAALAEEKQLADEVEWIVDEWKHQWPLAPEELLEGANAHQHHMFIKEAERDIAGRFLMRDTSGLTKRLSKRTREESPRTCFFITSSTCARDRLESWRSSPPKGRTAKALAQNTARRRDAIAHYTSCIALAEQYEAATTRIRTQSGIEAVQAQLEQARIRSRNVLADISFIPAFTLPGLKFKIAMVRYQCDSLVRMTEDRSVFGQIARLMNSIAQMEEGIVA